MKIRTAVLAIGIGVVALTLEPSLAAQRGGNAPAGPPVSVTVNGRQWTQQQLFQRNIGGPDDQTTQFPPHKIIGNLYYVGTASLASFLVVTPQGNILINSTYERNVPRDSEIGGAARLQIHATPRFCWAAMRTAIIMEGDALVKQLTGAQVMAMAEDVPALEGMMPGGKPHPDRSGPARRRRGARSAARR